MVSVDESSRWDFRNVRERERLVNCAMDGPLRERKKRAPRDGSWRSLSVCPKIVIPKPVGGDVGYVVTQLRRA